MSKTHRIILVGLVIVLLAGIGFAIFRSHQQPAATAAGSDSDRTVYVTDTGECYHAASCTSLSYSKHPMPLSEARKYYRPCKRCGGG